MKIESENVATVTIRLDNEEIRAFFNDVLGARTFFHKEANSAKGARRDTCLRLENLMNQLYIASYFLGEKGEK